MDQALLAFAVSAAVATIVAICIYSLSGDIVRNWVRRFFLLLINLCPWTIGTWRRSFTRRETAFAAWFLAFILTFVLSLYHLPKH
jgi:hypothetical protein